jgi:deoxyribose-phosphate aldolase
VANGADELDMVLNIGAVKAGGWDRVENDIRAVVQAAGTALVKVILETCYLTDEEIVRACQAAVAAGAGFVKTSTGFGPAGAKPEHVRLMRQTVGPNIGVKAAGGIRTFRDAQAMIEAGATRLGASSGVQIIKEAEEAGIH